MSRKSLTPIQLPADPTNALEAATKQYVDGKSGGGSRLVAFAKVTANQTATDSSSHDVVGLSVSWTADPTRTYQVTLKGAVKHSAAPVLGQFGVNNQTPTFISLAYIPMVNANYVYSVLLVCVPETGLSGSQTRTGTIQFAVSPGTGTWQASTGDPAWIMVQDIT